MAPQKSRSRRTRTATPRAAAAAVPPGDVGRDELSDKVGVNLRRLRTGRGLSLDGLARASGVSRSMLGQVELGQSAPTIKTLWRIAGALGVPFASLLADAAVRGPRKMPAAEARRLTSQDGTFTSRALFPAGAEPRVEFYELRLDPHAIEHAEPHAPGTQENLVVAQGTIELTVAGQAHRLGVGDAILFPADADHVYANAGARVAVMYLVMTYAGEAP